MTGVSNRDPLDLVECDLIAGTVVELGRTRAFVRRHRLGVLERAAPLKVSGDPRSAKSVAADPALHAELGGAALDHAPGVNAVHHGCGERASATGCGAEEGGLFFLPDAGRIDVGVQIGLQIVVRRHFVTLAAFLAGTNERPIFVA
jgi:hypothetical protein